MIYSKDNHKKNGAISNVCESDSYAVTDKPDSISRYETAKHYLGSMNVYKSREEIDEYINDCRSKLNADKVRYGKPCMTNLPADLGRSIFEQMDNAIPDREELRKRSEEFKQRVLKERSEIHEAEVTDMLTEYDETEIMEMFKREAREEALVEGRVEGLAEGRNDSLRKSFRMLLKLNFSKEDAIRNLAENYDMTVEEVSKIVEAV